MAPDWKNMRVTVIKNDPLTPQQIETIKQLIIKAAYKMIVEMQRKHKIRMARKLKLFQCTTKNPKTNLTH